ncbi:MAG: DMT family transporter [Deltaproteobacteria bacterium]|nr:DMT family transporter [Deltaproteobacteria bacterium]
MSSSATLRLRVWGVVLVNFATLAWATNSVAGRWLRDDIGPVTLTALRFTLATAFFGLMLQGRPKEERRYGKDKWWLLGMALAGVIGFSPLLYLGLRYSTAVNGSLIQGFSPLVTALLAGMIIQEPVSNREKVGAVLGFIGIVGLISGGSLSFLLRLQFNPGDLFLLAAAMLWPFYSIFGRRVMRHRSPVATMALSNFLALPVLFIAAAFELQYVPLNLRPDTIAAILHICVVPTIVGFWCWNRSVQVLGAGRAMIFYNTLPLYGVFMGALLLGEPLGMVHLVFGGMIIGGGLWSTLGGLKPRK